MKLHNIFSYFLRFLQISVFFPYSWEEFKVKNIVDENKMIAQLEISLVYTFDAKTNFPGKFIYNKYIAMFSNFWLVFILVLGAFIGYGNIFIVSENAATYKYSVTIVSGLIYASFIVAVFHLKTKSKILLEIIKNVISIVSENHPSRKITRSWWFFRVLFSITLYTSHLILQLIIIFYFIYKKEPIFFSSELFYYAYKGFINMSIVLILDIICLLYSFGYNIDHLKDKNTELRTFWDISKNKRAIVLYNFDSRDLKILENDLNNLLAKYHLMNKYQEILNSYFGILISSILVEMITHIIFGLYLFAEKVLVVDVLEVSFMLMRDFDFANKIINIFTSTEIINEKVRFSNKK